MKCDIAYVIMCQGIHFVIGLLSQLQIIGEVTFGFFHPVQSIVCFAPPVEGVCFGLPVEWSASE